MDEKKYDIIVAQDGSGDFTKVQDAIDSLRVFNQKRVTIFIKNGVYEEKILVDKYIDRLSLIGESQEGTILTYGDYADKLDSNGKKYGTFRTATVQVLGNDFYAENITFRNTAGPVGQALALEISADRAFIKNCTMLGWQDTLLAGNGRQYYKNCHIEGHCDFIFGGATAVFEDCSIRCLSGGYITAASTPKEQKYGFVFINCNIYGDGGEKKTDLGRPWRPYAHTVFLNCQMDAQIRPEGWNNWRDPEREKTARYAEYNSYGPGANPEARVKWSRQLSSEEAQEYTIENIFGNWNPLD